MVAEVAVEIRVLRRQGGSIREIARMLDVLVLMLEAAQRQGRYRQAMHRAVNAYRQLII